MKPSLNCSKPDLARRRVVLATLAGFTAGCQGHEPAPRFDYTLLDGSRHRSEALRGKVVLMNFWATSCASCVQEMPRIAATHRTYAARGLETLAVALQHDAPARVADFAQRRALPFGVVIDNTGAVAGAFGQVRVTPTSLLIDRRGRIVWRRVGTPDFAALHARVESLLQEPA